MDQEGRIRKYWHGMLSDQEKDALETEMRADANLAKEVQHFRDLQLAIAAEERQALKQQLGSLPLAGRRRRLWPIAAAAAVLLLLAAAWFLQRADLTPPEELFATYYEPYPNVTHPVVRQQETADSLTLAFAAYEQGDYAVAAERLEQLLARQDDPEWRFYLALSLLSQGEYAAARAQLEQLPTANFRFQAETLWYRALLSLGEGDKVTARTHLLALRERAPDYESAAVARLLEETAPE
ncbi:MAG: tetratricopeptide repeat protein [Bacteroidota bacterium]